MLSVSVKLFYPLSAHPKAACYMSQVSPALNKASFSCPHCRAIAAQRWFISIAKTSGFGAPVSVVDALGTLTEHLEMVTIGAKEQVHANDQRLAMNGLKFSRCFSCSGVAIWVGPRIVWPTTDVDVFANPDMPGEVKADFEEAASIVGRSPRGAAALLRLALQKLVSSLVGGPIGIDDGIQALVDAGLPKVVQQACDYVRIVGNDAVHPGQIDLKDDVETATRLFQLLNLIVTHTISFQKTMEDIYPALPANKLKGVEDRARGAAKKLAKPPPPSPASLLTIESPKKEG